MCVWHKLGVMLPTDVAFSQLKEHPVVQLSKRHTKRRCKFSHPFKNKQVNMLLRRDVHYVLPSFVFRLKE